MTDSNSFQATEQRSDHAGNLRPRWFSTAMQVSAFVATILIVPLGIWESLENPFIGDFDLTDFLVMCVGGCLGAAFWCIWSLALFYAVARRWWSPLTLVFLMVALFLGYIYVGSALEYLADRQYWDSQVHK